MAENVTIGGSDKNSLFVDEDKTIKVEVFAHISGTSKVAADTAMETYHLTGVVPSDFDTYWSPTDCSGWTVVLDVRSTDTSGTSLLSKTGSVTGSYNSTRAQNTQRIVFTIADTDLPATTFARTNAPYRFSIKRTDAGSETLICYGNFSPQRATQV